MLGAIQRATLLAHIAAEARGCFAASPWLWHVTGQSRGTRDNSHCLLAALDITPGLREKLRPACWEAAGQAAHGLWLGTLSASARAGGERGRLKALSLW